MWYISKYVREHGNESGSDQDCHQWVKGNDQHIRNTFDTFNDEEDL